MPLDVLGGIVLGSFLGGCFNVLLDRLTSPELVQFLREKGFEKKIDKWRRTLEIINALLQDAEEKQLTDNAVKLWLDDLEELAYDAEDMLNEFEYEATASMSVDDVTKRFQELLQQRVTLGLQVTRGASSTSSRSSAAPRRPPTSGHRTEPDFYGRDADKREILDMVLKNEPTEPAVNGRDAAKKKTLDLVSKNEPTDYPKFLVIPIVGMPGVGKTTLAREVFIASEDKFDVKAWVCVSDGEFDVTRISKSILENITGSSSLPNDLATVQDRLKKEVAGKKLMLVLDDVWSSDYGKWQILQSPFTASEVGSRIIVTTRDEGVALNLRPSGFYYRLGLLQPGDCWSVFAMCAFEKGADQEHHEIELIREKVIEKIDGLPLAAKTLGGLLRSKKIDEWLGVLNSKLWDLSENDGSEIPAALKLSYYHLPSHLKRCFAYCAIFPKDHEFEIEQVVLLWIAEGLVQQSTENEQLEDLGGKYFCNLLERSLFQHSSSDNGHTFVMHDLVHDLAEWALGKRNLRLDGVSAANRQLRGLKKVCHCSYNFVKYDDGERFKVFDKVENSRIRTFLSISQDNCQKYITNSALSKLLSKFKRLRVLSLQSYCMTEVPIPKEGLKHLRYLNLSKTMIRSLPESTISLLHNLQILTLRDCEKLEELPSNLRHLIKLQYLDIKGANLIKEMPLNMKDLRSLQKLSNFIVGKVGSSLKDLMSLKMLRGKLCITKLDNVIDFDYKDPILRDKYLKELQLEWGSYFHRMRGKAIEEKVLDMLQPHKNLQELTITYYGGTKFPPWVGASSYSKMKVLRLKNCERCTSLPCLGVLGSLEELTIEGMKGLRRITSEFYGNGQHFKSLKTRCFEDLSKWADWESIKEDEYGDAFPCLKMLSIKKCPRLFGSLPKRVVALKELVIEECEQLVVSSSNFPELCKIKIDGCKRIACDNPVDFKSKSNLNLSNISEFSKQLMQECIGKAELQQVKRSTSEAQLDEICPKKLPVGGLRSFRCLTQLFISNCSNILSFLEVCSLPRLSKLQIHYCNALISLPEKMKMEIVCLQTLEIWHCDSLAFIVRGQLPPSLKRLDVHHCKKLESLWDDIENDKNINSSLLEHLDISSCNSLPFIVRGRLPPSVKRLDVHHCKKLESLWDDIENDKNINSSLLEHLDISSCNSLPFIVRGQLPPSLKRLEISGCQKLKSLWDDREGRCSSMEGKENGNNTYSSLLEYLSASYCPSLLCLSSIIKLPATLKHLQFEGCERLTELLQSVELPASLKHLDFRSCPQLTTIREGFLDSNTSLEVISIRDCHNLLQIPSGFHNLSHLQQLTIWDCPSIDSFPKEGLADTNLRRLQIKSCKKLKALPIGLRSLNSLEELIIFGCPSIASFKPAGAFPTNLKTLELAGDLVDWRLHNLTSLTSLKIWECLDVKSFPDEEKKMQLPPSLTDLSIAKFQKLERLWSQGFRNLASLQSLSIEECPALTSLGDEDLPSSLEYLRIRRCPKLTCVLKPGLPSSLQRLDIGNCCKLKAEFKTKEGREWYERSNVLEGKIDDRHIFELEEDEEAQSSSCYRDAQEIDWLTWTTKQLQQIPTLIPIKLADHGQCHDFQDGQTSLLGSDSSTEQEGSIPSSDNKQLWELPEFNDH